MSLKKTVYFLVLAVMVLMAGQRVHASETNTKENNKEVVATEAPIITVAPKVTKSPVVTNKPETKKTKNTKSVKKGKVTKKKYTKSELRLMASIINCEAGAEGYQGKVAVGIVVMNRVKSSKFPNTVRKVIYQKYQFSPVRNGSLKRRLNQYDSGKINSAQWKSCIKAAKQVLEGRKTILLRGKEKSMKGIYFFSGYLANAKFKLGGHRFR